MGYGIFEPSTTNIVARCLILPGDMVVYFIVNPLELPSLPSYISHLFCSVFSGKYDIYVDIDGKKKLVGNYNNEGFFGELALMYNMPRAATIVASGTGCIWGLVSECSSVLSLFVHPFQVMRPGK